MPFKIFAVKVNGNHHAIPMKGQDAIGFSFDTKQEAEQAYENADSLQIPSLNKGSYRTFPKNNTECTIIEIL